MRFEVQPVRHPLLDGDTRYIDGRFGVSLALASSRDDPARLVVETTHLPIDGDYPPRKQRLYGNMEPSNDRIPRKRSSQEAPKRFHAPWIGDFC